VCGGVYIRLVPIGNKSTANFDEENGALDDGFSWSRLVVPRTISVGRVDAVRVWITSYGWEMNWNDSVYILCYVEYFGVICYSSQCNCYILVPKWPICDDVTVNTKQISLRYVYVSDILLSNRVGSSYCMADDVMNNKMIYTWCYVLST